MLNTYTLHYFYVTAQYLSFSKAAKHLLITQPALSKQIQQLEDQLKVKLFDRSRRSVKLTEAGKVLMEQCEEVFESLARVDKAMDQFRTEARGSLHIAAVPSVGNYLLPDFLQEFGSKFPEIKLHAIVKPVDEIMDLVKLEEVDFGLTNVDPVPAEFEAMDMCRQRHVFICSNKCERKCNTKGHEEIRLEDLTDCRLMTFDRNTATRRLLDSRLRERGLKLDILFESENVEILKQMVLRGMGGAIVPEYTILEEEKKILKVVPVSDDALTLPLRLFYSKSLFQGRAHKEFLDMFDNRYGCQYEKGARNAKRKASKTRKPKKTESAEAR